MKLKDFDFRVWNKKSNFYVEKTCGNIISIASDSSLEYNARENKILAVEFSPYDSMPLINKNYTEDDYEIELFTGLYDKNGKKIYENDIITLCHFAQKCIGVVRFGRNGFVITSKDENAEQGGELSYFEKYFYNFEVVGNIHENHI
ncbi:YopX family protein [Campylobacter lari]|uniref:YopX family protein n=1 Tax=Campylobacter lari TaxID=201 RepID=UPI0021F6BA88|nr:YopX family protein [Campylobacter lari]MCW0221583.1 YopX family protein [Campylobacter lari]MCW0240758.1 YopX family protein [Campylobacter lari]